ncbi:homeobox protein MSX-1-like [Stylophora pistillata]|uniref:Homeobox protein MSX-1 n=1 Tax=Stylophora pistillata TaxID=50429 RepID=A0A2B4RWT4_STYPI|nr:homeobox protein MSX-1-like [Stylophora pistillata]PFX20705.1 Homeobox protein MSX-1 [Stylophora pistillata]
MEDRISDSEDNSSLQAPPAAKPYLSFSIENILSEGKFGPRAKRSTEYAPKCDGSRKPSMQTLLSRLPWLAYTRYCPPKIPRSKTRKGSRRHKLDRNPRIPFSSSQLAALEAKFIQTQYLSGSEVRDLSSSLRVTEHRVKIWFQNRRAREKKTQAESSVDPGSPQVQST